MPNVVEECGVAFLDRKVLPESSDSKGSAKVDRMAAVINELATQRKQMQSMMSGMSHSMSACPMMKGAEKAPGAQAPEHKH